METNNDESNPSYLNSLPLTVITHYSQYRNTSLTLEKRAVGDCILEIDDNYEILYEIGMKFTKVFAAKSKNSSSAMEKADIAIKKNEYAFNHKAFARRTLKELKILRLLQHENILPITTLLLPKSRKEFEHIYVCTPLMETKLTSIIKSSEPLSDEHIQLFIYQILCGLKYIHSAGIVHRDLKPRSMLVNSNYDLKIIDFGSSRAVHCADINDDVVTCEMYSAPELLLEVGGPNISADVWSVGCILAELLWRKPFLPGHDAKSQLHLIYEIFGTPTEDYITTTIHKPRIRKFLRSLQPKEPKSLEALFPKANPLAVDLLKGLMAIDIRHRMTVDEALAHPYIKDLHNLSEEPTRKPIPTLEFEFEKYPLSFEQIKNLIYEEILMYHFPDFKENYLNKIEKGENPFEYVIHNENANDN